MPGDRSWAARLAALIHGGWDEVADATSSTPASLTNDRPYFAAYIKTEATSALHRPARAVQDEWGYLLLWATLGVAAIAALSLVLFPVIFGWRTIFSRYPGKFGTIIYFACLGLGYIMVEVGLIADFILALGNPTVSASVLITGMLVFSGWAASSRSAILDRARARDAASCSSPSARSCWSPTAFLLDPVARRDRHLALSAARSSLCLLLIAPPAFLMGFPMPTR